MPLRKRTTTAPSTHYYGLGHQDVDDPVSTHTYHVYRPNGEDESGQENGYWGNLRHKIQQLADRF